MRFPTLFACAAALLLISAGASHAAARHYGRDAEKI